MSTRTRYIATASELFRVQGFDGTGVGEIAEVGELPIGSLYYHFPGGKEELGAAAIAHGAKGFSALLQDALQSTDQPGEALAACARSLADALERNDYRRGCPVATVALETVNRSEILQEAAETALKSWTRMVTDQLTCMNIPVDLAADVALVAIATLEGAEFMARVAHSRQPLEAAADLLPRLLDRPTDNGL